MPPTRADSARSARELEGPRPALASEPPAAIGAAAPADGGVRIDSFEVARQVMRAEGVRQAGFRAELLERFTGTSNAPVLFQEGEPHQKQRSATARFFAPKVVATRYRELMERLSEELVERFRAAGRARLDDLSLEMAVAVAAEIVGLTNSSRRGMAERLSRFFAVSGPARGPLASFGNFVAAQYRMLRFYWQDVRPAIRARRVQPGEDVISHLVGQGYSDREILTECLTYGAAGMATTREFIVMAAVRLFEHPELKDRFMAADEAGRIAILEEVLRLEPVVFKLKRRTQCDLALETAEGAVTIPARTLVEIDVRAANRDPAVAGACPHALDPERARAAKAPASMMSFGDGPHRCPGAPVALQETAIFLERLLRVPGLRLDRQPTIAWNPVIASYELRGAVIAAG
jgi:cytochrome P450